MSNDPSGEEALIAVRRDKVDKVRARGDNPFANDVVAESRSTLFAIRQEYASALLDPPEEQRYEPEQVEARAQGKSYVVFGRLIARRGFGKVSFLVLRDGSGELQLFAKKDVMQESFSALEDLDIADHVEARGEVMVTKKGELSLMLHSLRLVAKALRPLPDKWAGLVDVDLRYRRRYVDMVANPEVAAVLRARATVLGALRSFLDSQDFIEVETPSLHSLIGGAAARPFCTHHNTLDLDLFLRIAPELYLKRLLVGGFERVYEIGRCYRNEGISTRHNPEFTMLEFYRAYATYETLMDEAEALLRHVDETLAQAMQRRGQRAVYEKWCEERRFTLVEPFARVGMQKAATSALERAGLTTVVLERLGELAVFDGLDDTTKATADAWVGEWAKASERAGKIDWGNLRRALGACGEEGERLFVAYEYLAEPFLTEDYRSRDGSRSLPVFVTDHPLAVSPLARKKEADPTLTDRFELFVDGLELCNAFSELNDPDDQAERFRQQVEKKARGRDETMDFDEDYVRALEHGMPPAAGFGLGVDRLLIMLTSSGSIRDVIPFPLLKPESKG